MRRLFHFIAWSALVTAVAAERPRLAVLTDIGGDPDDQQSMVRLMVYANEFEIELLVASASGTRGELKEAITRPDLIRQTIDAYAAVLPNLRRHAGGWPTADELRARVIAGNPLRGRDHIGEAHDTAASRALITRIDAGMAARPLNISIWGGQTDLAQALWRVKHDRGAGGFAEFAKKFRVYDINDQDGIADWVRAEFPGLHYILAQALAGRDKREGIYRGMYLTGDESLTSAAWVEKNVHSRGALGALYPTKTWTAPNPNSCLKEGDTPSWFFFLPRGGNDPADPAKPGWGGQFERQPDGWYRDVAARPGFDPRTVVSRARPEFQRDFAERMAWCVAEPANEPAVFQATGIKITEPTATSVSVWTRLTRDAARVPDNGPLPITHLFDRTTGRELALRDNGQFPNARPEISFPPGADLGSIRGAAIGTSGQTRVRYRAAGAASWTETAWRAVDPQRDFTAVFALTALRPGTRYEVEVEGRRDAGAAVSSTVAGGFVTAPTADAAARVIFCVMTCQQYEHTDRPDGFAIYPSMLRLRPDFFVNTGDALYYDHGPVHAVTLDLARYHWARMFSFPLLTDFHRQVGSYFMKDDHDTLTDDCHPDGRTGDFSFADGVRVFQEQTALADPPYRTARWGRHLQVWLMEGRDFRSTRAQDRTHTPTIWGEQQIAWLERTMAESTATFRVIIVPEPMVGPDRPAKDDNYSNAGYREEGARLRAFLAPQKNLFVITGDRHWQYVSVDPTTGVEEWSVGAASDVHAGGWEEEQPRPMHRFLRIRHGGFLSGEVAPRGESATLTLRLHDTEGRVVFESAKPAVK